MKRYKFKHEDGQARNVNVCVHWAQKDGWELVGNPFIHKGPDAYNVNPVMLYDCLFRKEITEEEWQESLKHPPLKKETKQ